MMGMGMGQAMAAKKQAMMNSVGAAKQGADKRGLISAVVGARQPVRPTVGIARPAVGPTDSIKQKYAQMRMGTKPSVGIR